MPTDKFHSRRRFLAYSGSLATLSALSALGVSVSGCQQSNSPGTATGTTAGTASDTALSAGESESTPNGSKVVKVYNWTEYISDSVLKAFTAETGIAVSYSTFDSNEAMYAKLKLMNNSGDYDVVFPGTDFVDKMRQGNMLEPINHSRLSNFKHLSATFLDANFDKGNQYSVPYLWGSSGIALNTKRIDKTAITSWNDLWRPEYKGRVMLMNDLRDVFTMTLLTLGYPAATQNPAHIQAAYAKLKTLMPNVRTFNSDAPRMPFIEGETYLGLAWNGEVIIAQDQGMPELDFVYPKEGAIMWMDNMVFPKNAKNLDHAYAFVDFILRPENSAIISEEIGYASPNEAAKKLLPPEIANNPIIYPAKEQIGHALFREDVGDVTMALYQQYWDRLKVDM